MRAQRVWKVNGAASIGQLQSRLDELNKRLDQLEIAVYDATTGSFVYSPTFGAATLPPPDGNGAELLRLCQPSGFNYE